MRTKQTQDSPARPAARPQTRASDADRDQAASLLNAAYAEGRLTADEHGERLSTVYAARTWQQLCQLTADLPVPADPSAERPAAPWTFAGTDRCLLCVLLILCPPAGIAWWLLGRRRPAGDPGRPGITFRGAPGGAVPPGREGEHAADR